METSGQINKTLANVSEEQLSSNTIISIIPDLKAIKNRVHPSSLKEDADTTEFLIEGIFQVVWHSDIPNRITLLNILFE